MRIHLIAIGGNVMHNLALTLQNNGHIVTGSDDEIFDPALARLAKANLLPPAFGWYVGKITYSIDFVILGKHAGADNPELVRALEMGLKVLSFPEFIYLNAAEKKRIVVAGSHGKTTTTAMIMHVLRKSKMAFDYLVGAQIEGFDTMVQLSDAPVIVIEGDEYPTSSLDHRPKFLHYCPHIAVVTGIAWDHINVFPSFEKYKRQFELLVDQMELGGTWIYFENDLQLARITEQGRPDIVKVPYSVLPHRLEQGKVFVGCPSASQGSLEIFGDHNLANLAGAMCACLQLGISEHDFLCAIADFRGAAKRLQVLAQGNEFCMWIDFAHAPSKVQATIRAVKSKHPKRRLIACYELHTFSSLNKEFLLQYASTMDAAELAVIFYSPEILALKQMSNIEFLHIQRAFAHPNLLIFTKNTDLEEFLIGQNWKNLDLLLMSPGNFEDLDLRRIVQGHTQIHPFETEWAKSTIPSD